MKMKAEKFKLNNSLKDVTDLKSFKTSLTEDINSLGGVNAVRIDAVANTITVDYNEEQVSSTQIKQKITEIENLKY